MGLFDGFEAGWNSFKNKELNQVAKWVSDNTDLDEKVAKYVKNDPKKAIKTLEQPVDVAMEQIYKVETGKANIGLLGDNTNETVLNVLGNGGPVEKIVKESPAAIEQGIKESSQPIWERDTTKKILGESGADRLQDTFNPARWVENGIDNTPIIPDNAKDTVKTYLPIVALGAGALILLAALK